MKTTTTKTIAITSNADDSPVAIGTVRSGSMVNK
jgi:hypothetical protein